MRNVHDVAAYILEKHGPMSSMKLQKLIYYSQAWHLVWEDEPLFDAEIRAWANGPVVYEVFHAHQGQYTVEAPWNSGNSARLTKAARGTIEAVLGTYGQLTGQQLSALTHAEAPWRDARVGLAATDRGNTPITADALAEYYGAVALADDAKEVTNLDWSEWGAAN